MQFRYFTVFDSTLTDVAAKIESYDLKFWTARLPTSEEVDHVSIVATPANGVNRPRKKDRVGPLLQPFTGSLRSFR